MKSRGRKKNWICTCPSLPKATSQPFELFCKIMSCSRSR
uniref:Uncharacterized protein n=1 Tax=Arundo donax TaxID=35708 RepID=A0A0A9G2U4_ARUDO